MLTLSRFSSELREPHAAASLGDIRTKYILVCIRSENHILMFRNEVQNRTKRP